jgi:hypothetical protein
MTVPVPETVTEADGQLLELFDLPADEATLFRLFRLLFEQHTREIVFGPCIQGAVFEIRMLQPATLTMLDGYMTVDFGAWHFHLCIGEHRATTPELAQHRRVKRAALYRSRTRSCVPGTWGLRLWNGHDEQMITVFFPNPYLSADLQRLAKPDWSRLALWDTVRRDFLGLDPDPIDRQAQGERMNVLA